MVNTKDTQKVVPSNNRDMGNVNVCNVKLCLDIFRGVSVMHGSSFKFSIIHVRGTLIVAADALSRMLDSDEEGEVFEEGNRVAVFTKFPASFQSLHSHQDADEECQALKGKVRQGDASARQFQVKEGWLVYRSRNARKDRVFAPKQLRHMIVCYFHDSEIGIHVGGTKTRNTRDLEKEWELAVRNVKKGSCQPIEILSSASILGCGVIQPREAVVRIGGRGRVGSLDNEAGWEQKRKQ